MSGSTRATLFKLVFTYDPKRFFHDGSQQVCLVAAAAQFATIRVWCSTRGTGPRSGTSNFVRVVVGRVMSNENIKDIVARFRTHVALGRELVHVRGQVVVLRNHFSGVVWIGRNTSTSPETEFQVLGNNREGAGGNVVGDIVVDIHIGFTAVGARYRTHVLDTTAHGGSRNGGGHIPTAVHVIVHQNVKEVVEAKNVRRRRLVLGPGHSVTVHGFIAGERSEAASFIVAVAQIRVVARVGVVTIARRARTVPVMVLTITAKATHDGLILALAEMVNVVEH
jgi:hypothetical protein